MSTQQNPSAAAFLWNSAERRPGAVAVISGSERVTYAELADRAGRIAQALSVAGVARDVPVGVLLERGPEAAAVIFGIYAAGGIAVVMDDVLRPRQVEHILAHSGARFLITSQAVLTRLPRPIESSATSIDVSSLHAPSALMPFLRLDDDVAQIVYTSGSSGLPKGVAVSHGNLHALTRSVNAYLGLRDTDRVAAVLPFSFVYGLGQLLCTVAAGATLVVDRSPLPAQIVETLRSMRVTVLAGVPSTWSRLLGAPSFRDEALPDLRVVTNAGGHLRVDLVRALRRAQPGAALYLMYGLTEALRCTYLDPSRADQHPTSIGTAIPGGEVLVMKEDGAAAGTGEIGELVYRGPTVTLGYWRDPVLTAKVFRPNPLRPHGVPDSERVVYTGDLVRRDASGLLYYIGRQDRIIKTMGYRVSPDEVVAVLHVSGEVVEAVAVGEPDHQWGAVIVAHVVLKPGGSISRLQSYCNKELPRYLRPSRILMHDALPLTPNGKPDLKQLAGSGQGVA